LAGRPLRFYVVGGAAYHTAAQFTEAELRAAAAGRGLGGRVGFVPFQPNPAGVYRALDVVVHASTLPEPFGLTVAEGMACGRAVVVSAAGGVAELFTDGADAVGVTPGDAGGLAAAVRRLAADPALRARLGANARATAETSFDAARYGPRLAAVYRSVLGEPG
jgi:glycosyltransferase involved in cell wall biosynthesis